VFMRSHFLCCLFTGIP